ncbi:glutathione S-transferase family protein [Aromatoleum toluvorans]|uniref:Glutathione S-transferase family protein n=1 Tax=Aromatoleum toluvorans TaxID=92002 RepID=A0ABX1PWA3_9RHOO|nr:glutathione S-transferase C-terminal domain-containing protein [Aromatoleum toluvorans]NMG42967.1 glutathione S-transferase family protein [Aromatoleum toluvorans]
MLVNGQWTENWQPVQKSDADGRFIRQHSGFRDRIGADNAKGFTAEAGRYQLYVAYICPWACRTLIALRLKGLEDVIDVCAVDPRLGDQGWAFTGRDGTDFDRVNGANYMHEIYTLADPTHTGRATVPVLWDRKTRTIVNNESSDIVRILDKDFAALATQDIDLRPAGLEAEIDAVNERLYGGFNNGVYRAGFAGTQKAYEEAVAEVFGTLDWMEERLAHADWLTGDRLTESDIRAFVTLVRFELAYYSLFKCNLRPLSAYPAVLAYLGRLLAIPAFAASVRPDHIKAGYYSIKALNPTGIVPAGPELDYLEPLRAA